MAYWLPLHCLFSINSMKKAQFKRCELSGHFISEVVINLKSQDNVLVPLSACSTSVWIKLRAQVIALLEAEVSLSYRKDSAQPSMGVWRRLVLTALKHSLNCDWGQLTDSGSEYDALRQLIGQALVIYLLTKTCWYWHQQCTRLIHRFSNTESVRVG